MPVQDPAAWHLVPIIWWAKLPQPGAPRPIDEVLPGFEVAQQSIPVGQSATGSSHCQSTSVAPQAVASGWHPEGVGDPAGVSQQCSVCGTQYSLGPPSVELKGQKIVPGPASVLGGWSFVIAEQVPASAPPAPVLLVVPPPTPVPPVPVVPVLVVVEPLVLVAFVVLVLVAPVLLVVPPPTPAVVVPPVLELPQAPRLAPERHPTTAPAISQPFFMIPPFGWSTVGDFAKIVAPLFTNLAGRSGQRLGRPVGRAGERGRLAGRPGVDSTTDRFDG
jgi:hypothetical protein